MDRARSIPAEIESFLAGYNAQVRAITLSLRDLVLGVAPGAMEQIDMAARLLAYGFARTYKDAICVIMPLKAGVNLGFPRGTDLPDPAGLLIGTGKRARHVRLSSVEQVEAPAVRALLEAALALWRGRA